MTPAQDLLRPAVLLPYTGGHTVIYGGYVFELCPDHKKANPFGFVVQHRLIVERLMGRYLHPKELVHHKDGNKQHNEPGNLEILTKSKHMQFHQKAKREKTYTPLTAEIVCEALKAGGLKAAAAVLGCHTETIRNNYPDLVAPYKRRSPTKIDDPIAIQKILAVAPNDKKGYREVAKETGVSYRTCQRICDRNGIPWTKKSRVGEIHKTYRRKTSNPSA